MTSGYSGNKDKGFKLSNENTSFVQNVTSRVSGLIPSTITKWFSTSSSSNANGTAPSADSTDSSTEDEGPENSVPTQPPAKRMRFSTPGKSAQYTPITTKCSSTNTESMEPLNIVQSPPSSNTFRRETNYVSTPMQSRSEEPTGNESSMSVYNLCGSVSTINNSIDRKRKSLFVKSTNEFAKSNDPPAASTIKDRGQPYFKPGLLGSPFYPGRTMYGGAASSYMNQPNIKQRKDTLINESSNNDSITMSHSARRVMDLLENYSSPLVEAKRIPQYIGSTRNNNPNSSIENKTIKNFSYKTQELHVPKIATILRLKQKSRLMDTTNVARQIIASHSSSTECSPYPKGQSTSQNETVEKMTTKIKTRVTRTNRGAQECELSDPITLPEAKLQIDYDNLPQFSFDALDTTETSTKSPLKSLSKASHVESNAVDLPKTVSKNDLSKSTEITNDQYKLSSPVKISNEISFFSNTLPKFTFGSPERTLEKDTDNVIMKEKTTENTVPVSASNTFSNKKSKEHHVKQNHIDSSDENLKENNVDKCCICNTATFIKSNDKCVDCDKKTNESDNLTMKNSSDMAKWKCEDCWVNNGATANKCVCCGSEKGKKNCNNKEIQNSIIIDKSKDLSKWKCTDCWVLNETGSEKCVCCGSDKINTPSNAKEKLKNVNDMNEKKSCEDWKCEDCWIKNKMSVDKCAACGGARPGNKISNSSSSLQVNNNSNVTSETKNASVPLQTIIKSSTDMWECPICLVRNENNRSKCVCCEAEKPGTKKELEKKAFSFGTPPTVAFKFGIDPKQSITENKPLNKQETQDVTSLKKPETNNNILPKVPPPSFVFGIPAKKPEDKNATEENKQQEPPKMTFTFGLMKQNSLQDVSKDQPKAFSLPAKPSEYASESNISKDGKETNVPSVENSSSKFSVIPKVPSNLFVAPFTSQFTDHKSTDITQLSSISVNLEKNETPSILMPITSATSVDTKVTQNNFTFAPSANLFSSSISTLPTSRPSFANQQPTLPTANISLFNKTDSNPISQFKKTDSTLLFNQKTDLVTTATPSSSLSPAPIFSFGNNQQSAVNQAEKPQFSFTFRNNNEPNLFKNTFGSATDGTLNSHNFSLPVSSSLATSGMPPGPTLGNSNSLATGNTTSINAISATNSLIGGNVVGSSELAPNTITSNLSTSSTTLPGIPATGLFSTPVQKDNMWSATNNTSNNLFVSNSTSTLQKPATFTFGATTTFNAGTPNSAFGTSGTPVAPTQQSQNVFSMTKQNNINQPQPSLFSNPIQGPPAPTNMFGAPSLANNNTTPMGMFSTPNVGSTSTFGTPNQTLPGFEAPSIAQAPAFNFGTPQSSAVFGFSQQQQPQQQQQPPAQPQPNTLYSFGAATGSSPQVQFNMGSAPNTTVRRVRKAIRRTTQR